MTALERAAQLFNRWASECLFLEPKQQSARLIHMIAEAIDEAEQEGYERLLEEQDDEAV